MISLSDEQDYTYDLLAAVYCSQKSNTCMMDTDLLALYERDRSMMSVVENPEMLG